MNNVFWGRKMTFQFDLEKTILSHCYYDFFDLFQYKLFLVLMYT